MKIPIFDLMDDCSPVGIEICEPDAGLAERICGQVDQKRKKPGRKLGLSLLIAAVIALLAAGTVAAVAWSQMSVKDVSGEKLVSHTKADDPNCYYEWTEASLAFNFTIEGDLKEVWFRPGWTPTPASRTIPITPDADGYLTYAAASSAMPEPRWEIQLLRGHQLKEKTFFLSGKTEIVLEDEWNGWQRTEVRVDNGIEWKDSNYLLLFSAEHNYLLNIGGEYDFAELERMAEELEIKVGGNLVIETPVESGLYESQPLDLDGGVSARDHQKAAEESLHFTFEVPESCPQVFFKAVWMPPGQIPGEEFVREYPKLEAEWSDPVIRMYWGNAVYNRVFYFRDTDGTVQLIKDDTWNGFRRIEVSVTDRYSWQAEQHKAAIERGEYELEDFRERDRNHLLLYKEDGGWLVHIEGYDSLETLEQIAEGLEFYVTEASAEVNWDKETEYYDLTLGGYIPEELAEVQVGTPNDPNALQLVFEEVGEPEYRAMFEAGWLPQEPTYDYRDSDFPSIFCLNEATGEELYTVSLRQEGPVLNWIYGGYATVESELTCGELKGYLVKVTGVYDEAAVEEHLVAIAEGTVSKDAFLLPDRYYLVLGSAEHNCIVAIHGSADLDTLKRIASNLEIFPANG